MQATWINLSTLTIRQKLLGGFAIVLSILALVVLSTLSSLSDTQNKVDNMTREVQPTLIASMNLMNTLQETSKALGFFLLTKEEHREKDYIDHLTKLDGALAELKATPVAQKNTTTMDVINEIEADINEFKAYKNQMVGLTKSINDNFPAVKHAADTLNPINSQFFQTISNMLLSEDEEEVNNDRKQLLKAITNLRYAWSNMTNNARIFLSFGSQDILENINLFVESAGTLIKEIKTHADILTFEQEEGLAKLEPMRQEWVGHLKKLVEIHRGAKARTDAYLLKTNIGPLLNKIDTNLKALLKQQQDSIEQTGDELISQAKSTHQLLLSLLFIGLIVGIGVSLWITSKITRPLKAAALAMNDIAEGDGDLTQRLAVNGHDEIAQLAAGFNTFILKIHNLVQQVTESTAQIAKVTVELTKATHSTSETTEKQKSETEQAATAITEMSATANEVAQNAEMASEAANSAYGQTTAGRQIVNRALAGINGMGETIEENAGIVEQLGKDITDITSIIDVIQGIAEQTNLLALNAAIEAARAGEQGRGFAVVADEVRTLATRTKQSTQDIQDKVEKLQTLANTVVDSIMLNKEKARDTIEQATEAGVSLDAITDAVANITDMVTQIASAAEEQSIVADDANRGIVIISELAEFTDHEAQQLSLSSTDLNQVTGTLQALVNQFKIEKVG